jgi:hypothetical protein
MAQGEGLAERINQLFDYGNTRIILEPRNPGAVILQSSMKRHMEQYTGGQEGHHGTRRRICGLCAIVMKQSWWGRRSDVGSICLLFLESLSLSLS